MRLPRVYIDCELETGAAIQLPDHVRHHLATVLRLRANDPLILFDGKSTREATAQLTQLDRKSACATVRAIAESNCESPLAIRLVQAVSKSDKMDFTLQKAVELGVTAIQPVYSERSQRPLKQTRQTKKFRHWQNVIISACEQCGRTLLPHLSPPGPVHHYLAARNLKDTAVILDPASTRPLAKLDAVPRHIDVIIGPESGFTPAEIETARASNITAVRLGPRILRTETAGIAALTWLQARFGDLGD